MNSIPFSVVFLAGGKGSRMGSTIPKQYMKIRNKVLALYSFELFLQMPQVQELVVVCEKEYQCFFEEFAYQFHRNLRFAQPGQRRQDSVYNGISLLQENLLVCIHDGARPFIDTDLILRAVQAANIYDSSAVGIQVRSTIKVCNENQEVLQTLNRNHLWEIQTPQVIRLELLREGFTKANQQQITVTDDVSLVELLGKKTKIVEGSCNNIKITMPEDILIAEKIIDSLPNFEITSV